MWYMEGCVFTCLASCFPKSKSRAKGISETSSASGACVELGDQWDGGEGGRVQQEQPQRQHQQSQQINRLALEKFDL